MRRAPLYTPRTCHRLRWWNRLRWHLGLRPFRRCPGRHRARNVYGDEIYAAGGHRSVCCDCGKTWPSLLPDEPNEVVAFDSPRPLRRGGI